MPRAEHRKGIKEWYGVKVLYPGYGKDCRFPVLGAFFTFWVRTCPKTGCLQMYGTIRGTKKRRFEGAENFLLHTQFGPAGFLPNGNMVPIPIYNRQVETWLGQKEPQRRFPTVGEKTNNIRPRSRGTQFTVKPQSRPVKFQQKGIPDVRGNQKRA